MVAQRDGGAAKQTRRAEKIVEGVTELVAPILATSGAFLDRIVYGEHGRQGLLQVFMDKEGGVSIEDCADVSRQLSAALDLHETISLPYTLEVSSPGLTRPLKEARDYDRYRGRLAALHLRKAVAGKRALVGVLGGVDGEDVLVTARDGAAVRVPLESIAKARLEIEP